MTINYVHHSGRFDKTPAQLTKAFLSDVKSKRADIVAYTEVSKDSRADALEDAASEIGWGFSRGLGTGHDECALTWDTDKFSYVDSYTEILTNIDTFTPDGRKRAPFAALFVVLKEKATKDKYVISVAHTPSHVQEGNGWHESNRARQHQVGCRKIHRRAKALKKRHNAVAGIISMDVNLAITAKFVKAYLRATFPTYTLLVDKNPDFTHGKRTIDCVLVTGRLGKRGRVKAYQVVDSDHKAIIVRLVRKALKK